MIRLMCPTRNRPEGFGEFLESISSTLTAGRAIEIIAGVDMDDPCFDEYADTIQVADAAHNVQMYCLDSSLKSSQRINTLACLDTGRDTPGILGLVNDDVRFRTKGWDQMLYDAINELPSDYFVYYPQDLFLNAPTFFFVSQQFYRGMHRKLISEKINHCFGDDYIADIARRAGVLYPIPFVLEHLHVFAGKGVEDENIKRNNAPALISKDAQAYVKTEPERVRIGREIRRRHGGGKY